jgi:hypothetical protein
MQKRVFNLNIVGRSAVDDFALADLRMAVLDECKKNGHETCATLGQIKFDDKQTINGRLYTGEAAQYLNEHIKVASKMQSDQESESHKNTGD